MSSHNSHTSEWAIIVTDEKEKVRPSDMPKLRIQYNNGIVTTTIDSKKSTLLLKVSVGRHSLMVLYIYGFVILWLFNWTVCFFLCQIFKFESWFDFNLVDFVLTWRFLLGVTVWWSYIFMVSWFYGCSIERSVFFCVRFSNLRVDLILIWSISYWLMGR